VRFAEALDEPGEVSVSERLKRSTVASLEPFDQRVIDPGSSRDIGSLFVQ
jgi:hypothetical protein